MTHSPDDLSRRARDRAEEEAALWLVRLAENPDDPELKADFVKWRAANPLHEELWLRTERAYDLVGKAALHAGRDQSVPGSRAQGRREHDVGAAAGPAEVSSGLLQQGMRRMRRWTGRMSLTGFAGSAAVLALVITIVTIAAIQAPAMLTRMQADYATATAETEVIELPDGSRVHLAPRSAVDVALTDERRRIRLLQGQAFFEVEHDPAWPFDVQAGDVTATALGTAFEVEYDKTRTRVAVSSGRVRVADATTSTPTREDLEPGDWIEIGVAGTACGEAVPDQIGDWRRGELIVYDRPIGEVVDELRGYHRGVIVVRNRDFAEQRVSGLYDLADPDQTLRDLAASHGAAVRRISPWVTVISTE